MLHAVMSKPEAGGRTLGAMVQRLETRLLQVLHHPGRTVSSAILPYVTAGLAVVLMVSLVAFASSAAGLWIDDWAHRLGHTFDHLSAAAARGEPGSWPLLLGGAALYGFLHALGPGHGKVLVGGVAIGSSVTVRRLMGLSLLASLAQAIWAIVLVYGALAVLGLSVAAVTGASRDVLAPLGGLLIAAIGTRLVWRAVGAKITHASRNILEPQTHGHAHHGHARSHKHGSHGDTHHAHAHHIHGEACGCAHAPSLDAVSRSERPWDALTLVLGIAIRPCTSALVLLALAWQAGIPLAGALATIAMGLGTATLVCLVAGSSVVARRVAVLGATPSPGSRAWMGPALRGLAGITLMAAGITMLRVAVGA